MAMTRVGAGEPRRGSGSSRPSLSSSRRLDLAALGELERVGQQVLEHLPEAMRVRGHRRRQRGRRARPRTPRRWPSAIGWNVSSMLSRSSASESSVELEVDRVRLDLGEVEDVVEELEQVDAGGADDVGVLHLARGEVALGVVLELLGEHQQAVERRAQLVRHVGDELRLVLEETASSLAFSSTSRFASSTSWYLPSTSLFLSASSAACSASSSLDWCSCSWRDCSSCA